MLADEYLNNLQELEFKYKKKKTLYNLQFERATCCTTSYSSQPKAPQRDPFAQERRLAKLNDMEREVKKSYEEVEKMQEDLERLLQEFTDADAMTAIHCKHISHFTISSIEKEIHCSRSTVYRLLDKGYAELDRILAEKDAA